MSDDFDFDDDSFNVDDSFLREVDSLTAKAVSNPTPFTEASASHIYKGSRTGGPQRTISAGPGLSGFSRSNAQAGPSRQPATTHKPSLGLARHRSTPVKAIVPPSSDDYDDLSFSLPPESFAAIDSIATRQPPEPRPSYIPSSKLNRSSSGNNGFMQTHLNFRRDKQSTRGKRWDRTEFAESGRRVGAERGKNGAKGKRRAVDWDDDEEEEMEDEDDMLGGPLAPYPKPFVDPNAPYEPQRHLASAHTITTYIYPTNRPKRDYQYEIIKACFTDNCLVALPTGLGKTFVAGVVMLNFYRWFPTGKIVFLAPTKPLVNQQIEACQLTCGIPRKDAAVMTGQSVSAKERARLWDERRVFYCTPQTLDNDLKKGSVDPRDIVLAVFDEAHKASGSYAYTTILAYITAHHPFFRVLALTATPGADVPRVQAVVDALHISRIEIREPEAPEIRKYMNEKRTEKHFVPMGEVIEGFRDRWAALMRPNVAKLVAKDILNERDLDIKRLRPFRLTAKRMEIGRDRTSGLKWAMGPLQALEKMARAMSHLLCPFFPLLEFSLGMFHTVLTEISGNTNAAGKKAGSKGNANSMRNNFEFQKLLKDVEAEMNLIRIGSGGRTKADRHPKMGKTLELLLAHFTQAADDERTHGTKNDTRAMVFCSFRNCVLEVVDMLNEHSPVLKATKFVGQAQGKQEEDKGFNQKEQKKTINEFKDGKYNILVSTSIGEEGLDIGEVDFVVIYDMPKQSIKLLQRIGRTGRKRDGHVHVLMSEGREDTNWDKAQETHREIQEEILHSRNLELFEDVEPLLPLDTPPMCVEQEMVVDAWNPDDQKSKRKSTAVDRSSPKAKIKKPRGHEIPEGVKEGFSSVLDLLRDSGKIATQPKKGKKKEVTVYSESEEDEAVGDELEDVFNRVGKGKAELKKRKPATNRSAPKKRAKVAEVDDNTPPPSAPKETPEEKKVRKEREEVKRSALDFFNASGPLRRRSPTPPLATPPSSPPAFNSPRKPRAQIRATNPPVSPITDESMNQAPMEDKNKLTPRTAAAAGFSQIAPFDLSWDDGVEIPSPAVPSVPKARRIGLSTPGLKPTRSAIAMPPPPVPSHRTSSPLNTTTPVMEATQFPVCRPGRRPRPIILSSAEKSASNPPNSVSPLLPPNRIRRRQLVDPSSSPIAEPARPPQRRKKRVPAAQVKELLDLDVDVSGSESPDEPDSDDLESESDLRFANNFQPTQAPKGYNQRAMYLAGMSTQATPIAGLAFKPRVDREAFLAKARREVLVTDDEDEGEGSENEYELGSFVCGDEDLSFATQSEAMSCT